MSTDRYNDRDDRRTGFEYWFDRILGDLPWGVFIFAAVAIGGLIWTITGSLSAGDYLAAVGGGSGLVAIGHGVRARGR